MAPSNPPPAASFSDFEAAARGEGCDEVLLRDWPAGAAVPSHSHPFDARGQVAHGEFWLTVGTDTRHLQAGDTFALARGTVHAERYGDAGTAVWVARRNAPGG